MAKQKTPTQQEIFKSTEEAEKDLCLPPGLINHGNTCFMNSTLQGLIATRYLKELIHFSPLPPSAQQSALIPIASRRSPLLTNGHGHGGEKYEKNWVRGEPIGDIFVTLMDKAWGIQQERKRQSMSPKELLITLGQKYDQYLDFRQQDAHEFLRQLLDAMRMEEVDMIKVRQPKSKRQARRRSTMRSGVFMPQNPSPLAAVMSHSLTSPSAWDDDEKLVPFVDMLFGGRLTSILVCQECKHISRTYEDFNDLSLSIKPEDYAKERKRDRLKKFAKKFKLATSGAQGFRSSSVPASPRKSAGESLLDEPPVEAPRRRSLDEAEQNIPIGEPNVESSGDADTSMSTDETYVAATDQGTESKDNLDSTVNSDIEQDNERDQVGFIEPLKPEKKARDEDGWAKLGRKISMSVRFPPKDKANRRRSFSRGRPPDIAKGRASIDAIASSSTTSISSAPGSSSKPPDPPNSPPLPLPSPSHSLNAIAPRSVSLSPALLAKESASPKLAPISPPLSAVRFPQLSRASSPLIVGKHPQSNQPPKPSAEEAAYLRQVLADVVPASNPLGIFKPPGLAGAAMSSTATQLLMKMGQLPGVEECLRMFTAVEILDGENMVGCRRCWKIANGVYKPKVKQYCEESDESDESDASEKKTLAKDAATPTAGPVETVGVPVEGPSPASSPSASASSSVTSLDAQSESTPYDTPQSSLSNETSLTRKMSQPAPADPLIGAAQASSPVFGGMPIPIISTTAPEPLPPTPGIAENKHLLQTPVVFKDHNGLAEALAAPLPIRDSLRAPRMLKHKRIPGYTDSGDESTDNEGESDASRGTSIFSDTSSIASRDRSANASLEQLPPPILPNSRQPVALKVPPRVSKPKQVIMRPAYKRYLVATPPPVLVIHLKRFQQVSKAPMISFSSGFKKLDDYVSFPENLDLAPFLAPKKEDFRLSKSGKVKYKPKVAGNCMYRLYAVVVHIGNMLGGHYVAYTALPTASPEGMPSTTPEITSRADTLNSDHATHTPRKWAYISDTVVRLATLDEVLKAKAYLCMYERV